MALTKLNNQSLSAVTSAGIPIRTGSVIQVKQALNNTKVNKSSNTFVDTTLFTGVTFDSNLQTNSKVLAIIEATIGEENSSSWSYPCVLTLYEGSTNIGNDNNDGLCGSIGLITGNTANDTYGMERVYGSRLYTPSSNNPSYKLYVKSANTAFNRTVGGSYNTGSTTYTVGGTRITLMEVAA